MQKYSRFGLAFAKEHLVTRGATPVTAINDEAPVPNTIIGELGLLGGFGSQAK
jgi:hypothetical protein